MICCRSTRNIKLGEAGAKKFMNRIIRSLACFRAVRSALAAGTKFCVGLVADEAGSCGFRTPHGEFFWVTRKQQEGRGRQVVSWRTSRFKEMGGWRVEKGVRRVRLALVKCDQVRSDYLKAGTSVVARLWGEYVHWCTNMWLTYNNMRRIDYC